MSVKPSYKLRIFLLDFVRYESSEIEKLWIGNVKTWQENVCSHITNDTIYSWISTVATINKFSTDEIFSYITSNNRSYDKYISHFIHNVTATDKEVFTIAIPIEGVMGIARDPRKCWDPNSETYTQSKEYLIPMNGAVVEYFANSINPNKKIYLFDAGATYYTDKVNIVH